MAKKIKNFVYELQLQNLDKLKNKAATKQIVFNNIIQKFACEEVIGSEVYGNVNIQVSVKIKKTFSDDPDEDEKEAPTVYANTLVINQELINDRAININLLPNTFEVIPVTFDDTALSNQLQLVLVINCHSNRYITDPFSKFYLAVTPELIQKMVSSQIIESKAMIKFKFISQSKQARTDKMDKQTKTIFCNAGESKKLDEIQFQAYDYRDILAIQIYNDNSLTDSTVQRLCNLIVLPVKKTILQQNVNITTDASRLLDE